MEPRYKDFARFAFIDPRTQAQTYWLEMYADAAQVQEAMGRAADIEDDFILSWGRLTPDEVRRAAACETYDSGREEQLEELEEQLARLPDHLISLYFGARNPPSVT